MAKKAWNKIIIGIVIFYILVNAVWYISLSSDKVRITVKSGDGASAVASQLKDGLIMSKSFLIWTKITSSDGKIKTGTYEFTQKDGTFKILGSKMRFKDLIKFTIPEGSNIRQTARSYLISAL